MLHLFLFILRSSFKWSFRFSDLLHLLCAVHGVEYAFGAHDYPTSGVFEVEPRLCPGFKFRKSIFIGTTCLDPIQVREFMERQSAHYNGDTYHLIVKNCNHFCKDICYKLTGKPIPKWVNRLAKIGTLFLLYYFPCQGSCQFKVLSAMCLMPPDTCFFSGWQTNSIDGVHKDWLVTSF